jgi:hypothetical protein
MEGEKTTINGADAASALAESGAGWAGPVRRPGKEGSHGRVHASRKI